MADYLALIRRAGAGYAVRFPDFPTIAVSGESLEDAREAARGALAAQIGFMLDEGLDVPEPSLLDDVMRDRRNRTAVALFLPAPPVGKPVRVTLGIDERLLREVDAVGIAHGLGRAEVIVEALRQHVATARQAGKIHAEFKAMTRARQRRNGRG